MEIKTLEVAGFLPSLAAMRNPMDSWAKNDSVVGRVGKADRELSTKLAKAGTEHCKHLRMIMVWADVTAPRYWWTEFDTYRIGVEKVSCSTMHRLMARHITEDDFEHDCIMRGDMLSLLFNLNKTMDLYKAQIDETEKKKLWREIIQNLPQSYLQKRTVMMSYAALRGMYRQRKGHKLKEWEQFRKWVETLPESWMITDAEPEVETE